MNFKNNGKRWLYLALGAASLLFAGIIYGWSILKAPLAAEFGWSVSALSMNFTLTMWFFCFGGMLGGVMKNKLGIRTTGLISAVLSMLGFFLASAIKESVGMLYLSYGILSGLGIGIAYNCIISTVSAWFPDKKGLCSGVLMMGFGASALVLGSLADAIISSPLGWRAAYRMIGVALGLILTVAAFVLRMPNLARPVDEPKQANDERDVPTAKMLHSASFWKAFACVVFLAAVGNTVISMAKDLAISVGVSAAIATLLVGVLSVCNGLGRVITGAVFDRLGRRPTMIGANILAISAAGITLLSVLSSSTLLCVLGLCMTGLSYGTCPTISSAFISEVYGSRYFPMNFAVMNCNLIFASLIATGASLISGATGSYAGAFILLLSLSAVALLINLSIKE